MSLEAKIENAGKLLQTIAADYAPAGFANSLGAEDMVLTDLIFKNGYDIEVFTLDTGRLPEETYRLIQDVKTHYGKSLQSYFPRDAAVEQYLREHGPNAFYDDLALRKTCCRIRKIEPLQRALKGKKAWITGLRREQAVTRQELAVTEWDADNKLYKYNPLADWTHEEVWSYIRGFGIPYNSLHDKGYPSIGCAPCTRAVAVGEDSRAGRWWWETPAQKECGLHTAKKAANS